MNTIPAPRLQLRWETDTDDDGYICHYELVIPLRKTDVRREVYNNDGIIIGFLDEYITPLNTPTYRSGEHVPCKDFNGEDFCDTPFRDGSHAIWDSAVLGNLPIYVIGIDGKVFKVEKR